MLIRNPSNCTLQLVKTKAALLDINIQAISESKLHLFSQTEILPMFIAALVTLKDEKAGSEACL